MTITDKLSHLTAINFETWFDDILKENEKSICDMARSQMYDKGVMDVNNPGKVERYSPATIKAKRKAPFNKTDFITLKWFGDFHESFRLVIFKEYFVIASNNLIWANFLETKDRFTHALGLTSESKNELKSIAREELIKKLRSEL
jgi:hypothetical protein